MGEEGASHEVADIEAVSAHHSNNHEVLVAHFCKRDRAPMFELVGTLEFEAVSGGRRVLDTLGHAGDPPNLALGGRDRYRVPLPDGPAPPHLTAANRPDSTERRPPQSPASWKPAPPARQPTRTPTRCRPTG
ncbi:MULTISPECIES: hypothetical protein [Streptomyces]|uniref:hypothetical protein n=1 Tax=Streptomyces TaxID=1883 RepID=UPI000F7AE87C|nr:hypothetical protein [Streptomyces sp. WAC05858]RSS31197.1 hypothetical protein EF902_48100 [Streptomyces sp. WAC05858]WTA80441.1 hypothetical protein OG751_11135 [Streptomyces antimycoticus]